jgi:hypothetical protein
VDTCKFCGKAKSEVKGDWQRRFGWLICPECWAAHKKIMWINDCPRMALRKKAGKLALRPTGAT